jgi:hypothetical protein
LVFTFAHFIVLFSIPQHLGRGQRAEAAEAASAAARHSGVNDAYMEQRRRRFDGRGDERNGVTTARMNDVVSLNERHRSSRRNRRRVKQASIVSAVSTAVAAVKDRRFGQFDATAIEGDVQALRRQ